MAYRGSPSWVFMNVDVPNYNGPIKCMLQVDDGSTVAFGTFTVNGGTGQFSKNIGSVDVGRLCGAQARHVDRVFGGRGNLRALAGLQRTHASGRI